MDHRSMARTTRQRLLLGAFALTLGAGALPALAADVTPGTYMLEGGSYIIEVRADGDGIMVVEPNRDSPYARVDDDEFHFHNPNTSTTYGIRYVDARTIEAFKPDAPGNVPSRLVLVGGEASDAPEDVADSAHWEALAGQYAARIESDPANVQSWTACAAVAMKRSVSTQADADAYAAQMKQMLQLMMDDGAASPCAEVIAF